MFLTGEQQAIVEAVRGPVLVTGGVGCGKTRVLAERAANALHRGISPDAMLAITFTNRAAREMRQRLEAIVGLGAAEATVTTFHSLCVRILRRDGKELAIDPSFIVWDETDSRAAVSLAAGQLGRSLEEQDARRLAERICNLKTRHIYPQNFPKTLRQDNPWLLELYRTYQHLLETSNALDFEDLVAQTWTLFRHSEATRQAWAERCLWVEIDEFQDTSDAEYDILHLLTSEHQNVCVFGDTNQWIYHWRGVDGQRIIQRFQDDFPHHRQIPLLRNFRSTPAILAAARAVLTPERPKRAAGAVGEDAVTVRACPTERDEREYLAQRIRELHQGGIPWRNIAVLTRTNRDLALLAQTVLAADIPAATVAASEFFRRTEVKDLTAFLRLIAAPQDVLALRRVANVPARKLPPAFLSKVEQEGRRCGLLLTDLVDGATLSEGDPCAWELDIARREFVALDCEATGLDPALDEPVTLAAVRVDGTTGARESFEAVLRPSRQVGASQRVHGFSDADLAAQGREPVDGLADLVAFIGTRPLVGHNVVSYDLRLLNHNLRRLGLPELRTRAADTFWLARRALDLDRYNLERVHNACGVSSPANHQALADAICAAECFRELAAHLAESAPARRELVAQVRDRFAPLARLVDGWRERAPSSLLSELVESVLSESGYLDQLRRQGEEGARRLDTLNQLRELIVERFDPMPAERALQAFLDYLSLAKNADRVGQEEDRVMLLTIHSAKGLEFDAVLIAGAHDGGIPAHWTWNRADDVAEEQRLLYVGMTRARQILELTYPQVRMLPNGSQRVSQPSRFLASLPEHLLKHVQPQLLQSR